MEQQDTVNHRRPLAAQHKDMQGIWLEQRPISTLGQQLRAFVKAPLYGVLLSLSQVWQ